MINEGIKSRITAYQNVDIRAYQKRISEEYPEIADNAMYGGKFAGSDAEHRGAEYIATKLKKIGVDKVEMVPFKACRYQFNDATLDIIRQDGTNISIKPGPYVSPKTTGEGISGELVEVSSYTPEGFEAINVKDKVILIEVNVEVGGSDHSFAVAEAQKRGALAVVVLQVGNNLDENTLKTQAMAFVSKIPVVGVTPKDADILRKAMAEGTVVAKLIVDSDFSYDGVSYAVIGEINGENPDERIVYSGHYDHYFKCMQDNISSVAGMLGIAEKMVKSGYKPKHTITFMFNGAHELGGVEGTNPYISGSYIVLDEKKTEWIKNTILDINFEYIALRQKQLRSMGSYETVDLYKNFIEYMDKKQEGFDEVASDFRMEDYIYVSWTDTVSFVSKGVPVINNDAFTQQYLFNDSPYIGRDHSSSDNWEVYDLDVLNTTTNWYGSLGIYVDQHEFPEYNFANRAVAMQFTDEEKAGLDAAGLNVSNLETVIDKIKEDGLKLYELVTLANQQGITEDKSEINKAMREIMYAFSNATDRFTGMGFVMIGHKIHLNSIGILSYAKTLLEAGEKEKAVNEALMFVDYARIPYVFGKEAAEALEKLAMDEKLQRWSKGKRVKPLFLTDLMLSLKDKTEDFTEDVKMIDNYIESEMNALLEVLKQEERNLTEIYAMIEKSIALLEK